MTIDLGTFEEMAKLGRLEAADIVRAYSRIMELDTLNSDVRRRRARTMRQKQAWKRSVLNYARATAPRFGLECSLPAGDRE